MLTMYRPAHQVMMSRVKGISLTDFAIFADLHSKLTVFIVGIAAHRGRTAANTADKPCRSDSHPGPLHLGPSCPALCRGSTPNSFTTQRRGCPADQVRGLKAHGSSPAMTNGGASRIPTDAGPNAPAAENQRSAGNRLPAWVRP